MKEVYIKDKVAYLTESSEAIIRLHKQARAARIANVLYDRFCEDHRRMEIEFISFAHKFIRSEML